jgi:hypothetical protein
LCRSFSLLDSVVDIEVRSVSIVHQTVPECSTRRDAKTPQTADSWALIGSI